MIEIGFAPWKFNTRPRGLKQTEVDIFEEYILATSTDPLFKSWVKHVLPTLAPGVEGPVMGEFAFQVRLLGGNPPPEDEDVTHQSDWEILGSLKADVIQKDGDNYTIYELKQRLDISTLGQLLTYKWLFEEVFQYPRGTKLVAVGYSISPGLVQPLLSNGVQIYSRDNNWSIPNNFSASAIRYDSYKINKIHTTGV